MKRTIVAVLMICQAALYAKPVEVLIDTSGSMSGREAEVLALAENLFAYSRKHGSVVGLTLFSDDTIRLNRVPDSVLMGGGTNLTGALQELNADRKNMRALIVITDGMPNDAASAKAQMDRMRRSGIKICGAYIGKSGNANAGRDFLEKNVDVFVSDSSAHEALKSCFDRAEIKDAVKATYEEKIKKIPDGGW